MTAIGTRVTRVQCDTCDRVHDHTYPAGPDWLLSLTAVLAGRGWQVSGDTHACPSCATQQERNRAAATLTRVRVLASEWAAQVPVDDAAVQQIEDGCALLLLIDGRTLPEATA